MSKIISRKLGLDLLFDPDDEVPDWNEPNTFSIMGEIAKRNGKIPIMIISGFIDEKAKKMAEQYGLSHLIYKWYPKPADYDMIALDTIKAINESKLKRDKDHVLKYINTPHNERNEIATAALNFLYTRMPFIVLNPNYLLDKLENLSFKIMASFDPLDIQHFRDIVKEHAYEYFKNLSLNHSALSEHLVGAISEADNENLGTEPTFKLILIIIQKLRQKILNEEEVYNLRTDLEDMLNVRLCLSMGTPEDVDRYLELIEVDDEEE